jgi:hypothetical protein
MSETPANAAVSRFRKPAAVALSSSSTTHVYWVGIPWNGRVGMATCSENISR